MAKRGEAVDFIAAKTKAKRYKRFQLIKISSKNVKITTYIPLLWSYLI